MLPFRNKQIKAVVVKTNDLISCIKSEQKDDGKLNGPIALAFFSTSVDDISTTGLNGHFIQLLLLIDVLLRMKSDESDKKTLISLFRKTYDDEEDIEIINEFESSYSAENALWWYSRDSFLYSMLNRALRTQDIHTLFLFRFFIRDIYEQLEKNQCSSPIRVYRGQQLSTGEVDNLRKSVGDFISINSFFSTSIDRSQAMQFINNEADIPDGFERVLFDIDAHPQHVTTKPFADISPYSKFKDEAEMLFMIGAIFQIQKIYLDEDRIWIIRMRLCSDENHHLKDLFAHLKKTYADTNKEITLLSFGRVLHQMGHLDLAEKFYKLYLKELPADDPSLSDVYYSLGLLTMNNGDYDQCIERFREILNIKSRTDPTDYIYLGGIYNAIGDAYRSKEEYNEALESFNKAVELFERAHAENHLDMAYFYNNIGLVYQETNRYSQALDYFEKSLAIKTKRLPPAHPSISAAHNNIGLIHYSVKQYDAALNHYQQSLNIQLKCLRTEHPDIAMSYENMGHAYEDKGDSKQALKCFQHADTIYMKSLAEQHPDILKNRTNIRRVESKLK